MLVSSSNSPFARLQLATPGHTRVLLLGRFRVREDADFLTLAQERFGFCVKMSDISPREGSSAASYKLIELCWPEARGLRAGETAEPTSRSNAKHASISSRVGSTVIGAGSLLLNPDAFDRLQCALAHDSRNWQPGLD